MNDALRMQISAYVDGELPENETELLLRRLSQDAALRQEAAHFLEIGRLLRREAQVPGLDGLRGRIAVELGDEQASPAGEPAAGRPRYLKPMAGFAIAASVALLALFGVRQVDVPSAADVDDADSLAAKANEAPSYTQPAVDRVPDNRLLDEMRWRHADSSESGSVDILTRFATLEIREEERQRVDPVTHPLSADDEDSAGSSEEDIGASAPERLLEE
jgi:sigma-E factor negative regulatory protein RseA